MADALASDTSADCRVSGVVQSRTSYRWCTTRLSDWLNVLVTGYYGAGGHLLIHCRTRSCKHLSSCHVYFDLSDCLGVNYSTINQSILLSSLEMGI